MYFDRLRPDPCPRRSAKYDVVAGVVAVLVDVAERGLVGEDGHLELAGLLDLVQGAGGGAAAGTWWRRPLEALFASLGVAADGPQAATEAAMINAADAATMLLIVLLMIDAVMVSPLLYG